MKPSVLATCFIAAAALLAPAVPVLASSSPAGHTSAPDPLGQARELVAARQYQAALVELRRIGATRNADWNNLMGYSSRKSSPPDLAAAEKYYAAALALNPKHLGTLEYLGEMRLQQGDLAGAEKELAALKQATFFKSEEFKDLQAAIGSYLAAGSRYLPKE